MAEVRTAGTLHLGGMFIGRVTLITVETTPGLPEAVGPFSLAPTTCVRAKLHMDRRRLKRIARKLREAAKAQANA